MATPRSRRPLALRLGIVLLFIGLISGGLGLLFGGDSTYSDPVKIIVPGEGGIIPSAPLHGPEPERGAPGSKEQMALFGGIIAAAGLLLVFGGLTSSAARRAKEEYLNGVADIDAGSSIAGSSPLAAG